MRCSLMAKAGAIALVSMAVTFADTLSIPIGPVSVITGTIQGQTRSRVLISDPIPDNVSLANIDFAVIEFPAFSVTDTHDLVAMQVYRVTTAWDSAQASWTAPWVNPGGDFDSVCAAWYTISAGDDHPVELNITRCVHAWQNGADNYGIILKRPNSQGGGFGDEVSNLREALRSARLKVFYHHG